MRKIIFHYHLFKNAGTSIDAILKSNFPVRWVTKEFNGGYEPIQQQVQEWCQQEQNAIAFSSHTALLPPPNLPETEIFPIIFIRHPIDRIASAYYFEKQQEHDNFSANLGRAKDLAGYIEHHLKHGGVGQCQNFQSHRLAQWFHDDKDDLQAAVKAVAFLPFIGLVEAFDESIHRLINWLSPHFPGFKAYSVAENVGRNSQDLEQKLADIRLEIGADLFQRLLEVNAVDMAIYEAVKARYSHTRIPKTIMQYWHSPELPSDIAEWTQSWKQLNPDFRYLLFNDESARLYLQQHFPKAYLDAFNDCALPAMRCDFFRYSFIYNEGGVYIDAASSCSTPLSQWLDLSKELVLLKRRENHIVNSLIISKARNSFLKQVIDECVKNIQEKISNNIWLVTGPGVINQLIGWNDSIELELISFKFFFNFADFHQNAIHKKTGHWSVVQKQQSIFNSGETKPIDYKKIIQVSSKDGGIGTSSIKLALIGHPRCGSKSLAVYLTKCGLATTHERLAGDGICSWWLTGRQKQGIKGFFYKTKDIKTYIVPELTCHFIRNPVDAIPSIMIENEFKDRQNNSFLHRRQIIKRCYNIDLAKHEALAAATLSYIYWNKLAEKTMPDLIVRVENMAEDLLPIIEYFSLNPIKEVPTLNTSVQKFGVTEIPAVDIETLLTIIDGKSRLYLQNYLQLYYPSR